MINRMPFHESVAAFILDEMDADDLGAVCRLLATTKIPKGHDAIIEALRKRSAELAKSGFIVDSDLVEETVTDLEAQKREATPKA